MKNSTFAMVIAAFMIPSVAIAQMDTLFLATIESIKQDMYKISAEELHKILATRPKSIPTITADELKNAMADTSKITVINVLPEKYYDDCHIKGSINAPLPDLVERVANWDRSEKIVLYCALEECDAGEKGCILLSHMGFTNVLDYKGGIKEWYQLGYPTNGLALSEYLHTRLMLPGLQEYKLYPTTIVCSRQTRWINRY